MIAAHEQLLHSLSACGAISSSRLAELQTRSKRDAQGFDSRALVEQLVQEERLTTFQARAILQGRADELLLGDYVLVDRLGAGGMGQVFKARHRLMKRTVAIKMLPPDALDSEDSVERFQREVEAAARLEHPNIVTAYDAGHDRGQHFLVMQYIAGTDLSQYVRKRGPLSIAEALNVVLQAARGLQYAHTRGVIHRDVKPGNLLLAPDGVVKVLDMGLARLSNSVDQHSATLGSLTGQGQVMGTVDFMAPEQAESLRNADHRADVYSLGCTLYYLLTGRVMYEAESVVSKILRHREAPIPHLDQTLPNLPEPIDELYRQMVAKSPDDRLPSMQRVAEEIESIAAARQIDLQSVRLVPDAMEGWLPADAQDPFGETRTQQQETTDRTSDAWPSVGSHVGGNASAPTLRHRRRGDNVKLWFGIGTGSVGAIALLVAAWVLLTQFGSGEGQDAVPQGEAPGRVAANGPSVPVVVVVSTPAGQVAVFDDHDAAVLDVAVSPDGRYLASASADKSLCVYDLSTGELLYRHRDVTAPYTAVAITSTGVLITGSGVGLDEDRNVRLWNVHSGNLEMRLVGRESAVTSIDASPDGTMFITTHPGGLADLRLLAKPADTFPLVAHDRAVDCWDAAFSADSQYLVTCGGDGRMFVWEVGAQIGGLSDMQASTRLIRSVRFSPSGKQIIAGISDGTIQVWSNWQEKKNWRLEQTLKGHTGQVVSLSFSTDGRLLASGSHDQTVRLWDTQTWGEVETFRGHKGDVNAVVFLPDGRVVSAGSDATVRVWARK